MISRFKVQYKDNAYSSQTGKLPPMRQYVEKALNVKSLELLHTNLDYPLFERETDQSTHWHDIFYKAFEQDTYFQISYKSIVDQIATILGTALVWQRVPTFRTHFPNNVAVGEWHKDSFYGHSTDEINIFVPLTRSYDTATLWVQDSFRQSFPLQAEYGDIWVFDGANLIHGNEINEEAYTRVSFDFRVIPVGLYQDSEECSINTGLKFKRGEYFA